MNDTKELRSYLVTRFFKTLIGVGVAQMVVNLAMRSLIMPLLEDVTGLTGLLSGKSLTDAIRVFWSCMLTLLMRNVFGEANLLGKLLRSKASNYLLGDTITESVAALDKSIGGIGVGLFAVKVVVFFLILVALWVLPFAIGASIYSRRVSDRIRLLEKERRSREREYEKRRNLLLSDITHDIKTPITTMAGFSKALADGTVPDEQRQEYLDTVYNKSMVVSDLVSMLFEYIKMDSEGYVLSRTETDFCEMVRECVAGSYAEFENKGIDLDPQIPDEPFKVKIDKMQFSRAINNLLSNTVKHGGEGIKVVISVKKEKRELVFSISDNGVRIEKEDAIHIFEPFVRGDKSRKSGEGNGLGLSIAKRVVELHGGRIRLIQYNNPDKYEFTKTFEIRLPM